MNISQEEYMNGAILALRDSGLSDSIKLASANYVKQSSVAKHVLGGGLIGGVTGGLAGSQISDGAGVEPGFIGSLMGEKATPDGNYAGTGAVIGALAGMGLGRFTGGLSKNLSAARELAASRGQDLTKLEGTAALQRRQLAEASQRAQQLRQGQAQLRQQVSGLEAQAAADARSAAAALKAEQQRAAAALRTEQQQVARLRNAQAPENVQRVLRQNELEALRNQPLPFY